MSNRPLRARSDREITPTSLPLSTTGKRRTWWRAISRVASRQSSPGATVVQLRLMISRTGVWAGSSSAATHRRTMSRSVTIPRRRRSGPHTGSTPTLCRLISRAASAAEEAGSTVTALGFIRSLTCMKNHPFGKIWPVASLTKSARFYADKGRALIALSSAAPPRPRPLWHAKALCRRRPPSPLWVRCPSQ